MDALRLLDWKSYGYACQCVFCVRTPIFVDAVSVADVVQQQRGRLNSLSSVIHSHATPGLVGSRGVAIVLPTTLTTSNQSYLRNITLYAVPDSSDIVKDVLFESLLPSNCDCGRF